MSWTDERVDTLKRLWGEGHSASQIATHLGGVSRNAVIGKVHRLGLESRKKDADAAPAAASEDAAPAVESAPVSAADDAPAEASAAPGELSAVEAPSDETDAQVAAPEPANDPGTPREPAGEGGEDEAVAPIPLKLKLTQLTERTCKWPIGDPMHDDFHFCGHDAEEGRPYCEYHSGLAFQPASERRRVR